MRDVIYIILVFISLLSSVMLPLWLLTTTNPLAPFIFKILVISYGLIILMISSIIIVKKLY